MARTSMGFVLPPSPFEDVDPAMRRSRSKPGAGDGPRCGYPQKKRLPLTDRQKANAANSDRPVKDTAKRYGISERSVVYLRGRFRDAS